MTEGSGSAAASVDTAETAELIGHLAAHGATIAAAESVTGGRLVAALTSVPGSSAVVRGAIVAYATDLKVSILGVDPSLLASQGPVCAEVAEQMAAGARGRLAATYGVSTTGEAGPDSASGCPVGTVYVAVAGPDGTRSHLSELSGDREQVQRRTVVAALQLLAEVSGGPGSRARPTS
ncbi:MAG TPA: CinA family protein [Motilibacterales bacterium]|nr:CinA family protein [Motilibacterales bacterium]